MTKDEASRRVLNHGWCRAIAHTWEPCGPIRIERDGLRDVYCIYVQCSNCGTTRRTAINRTGGNVRTSYTWPENYKLDSQTRMSKADVRRMIFVDQQPFKIARGTKPSSIGLRTKERKAS